MAGHGVVLVALTLATWSLCLLHSTGQEVSPGSSVEEIVAKCSGRNLRSLCDPQGVLTAEEELEIRRSLADIERTSFARNSRICGPSGQHLNATVVVLPVAPKPSTSSLDREDTVNSLIQALLPDRTICNLVAIFLLKTSKLYWTLATGTGSDAAHKIHGRTLKMATRNETRLETIKRNLYDIVDVTAEEPYYLARGVISFGKPAGGGGGSLAPLGWGGDWTIMLYIGIGLISTITVLAFIVCCLLYRRKKLLKKWKRAETDAAEAAVMVNISERNAQPKQSP